MIKQICEAGKPKVFFKAESSKPNSGVIYFDRPASTTKQASLGERGESEPTTVTSSNQQLSTEMYRKLH